MNRILVNLFLLIWLSINPLFAQKQKSQIIFSDSPTPNKCGIINETKDTISITKHFSRCLLQIHGKGYIAARIDSIKTNGDQVFAYGQKGELYEWMNIEVDSISTRWINTMNFNPIKLQHQPVKPSQLIEKINNTLDFFENNGYPFATVSLTNTYIDKNRVNISLGLQTGPYISYDTLIIKGDLNVSRRFLESYLGINKGKAYSERSLRQIDSRLSKLPFTYLIKSSEVEFIPGKVKIYSYLTNRKSSRFSGLAGFSSGDGGGLKLTGNLNLRLLNSLKNAETLNVNWYGTGGGKQSLKMDLSWPYVVGSNMVIDASLRLYKHDSTYLNLNPNINFGFFTPRGEKLGVGYKHKSSKSLVDNNINIREYTNNMLNLIYGYSSNSYQEYSTRGIEFSSSFGIGKRRLAPTDSNQRETTNSYEFGLNGNIFFPFFWEKLIFKVGLKAEKQLNSENGNSSDVLLNELYRIGGSNALRGFEEESILADGYSIAELEIHLSASDSFSFYLFYDKAYTSAYNNNGINPSWPSGIGAGFILQSSSGILNLAYAMGNGFGQTIGIPNAKIHIGFTANF